ncbi:MAG: hypothetical protein QNJ55_33840 [Xenococcus sp. MO_188.B8]|nr:hypothetical protein [Xenococcus sp. MO_188.B8]
MGKSPQAVSPRAAEISARIEEVLTSSFPALSWRSREGGFNTNTIN